MLLYFHFMLIAYAKTAHVIIRILIQTIYFLIHNLSGIQNDGDGREETDTQSNSLFFLNSSLINQIRLQNRGRRFFAYEKLPTSSILLWDKVHFFLSIPRYDRDLFAAIVIYLRLSIFISRFLLCLIPVLLFSPSYKYEMQYEMQK